MAYFESIAPKDKSIYYAIRDDRVAITLSIMGNNDKLLRERLSLPQINVDQATATGIYYLHLAAEFNNIYALELLLDSGADIDRKTDIELWTALHFAVAAGREEAALLLIERGADIHSADANGITPLHIAGVHKNEELWDLLDDAGADRRVRDKNGHAATDYYGR